MHEKIEKDDCTLNKEVSGNMDDVRGFFGYICFAASSKAIFDGTHPFQWTPSLRCGMSHPFTEFSLKKNGFKNDIHVENCITHNG